MKKYFLILRIIFLLFLITPQVNANSITKYIKDSDFETKSTVSIDIENFNNDEVIYKRDEKKLLNPASILKVLTFGSSYKTLGKDYEFETALFKDNNNNLYLKLSADTLLTQSDLNKLFTLALSKIKAQNIKNIFIDDTIIDKAPYPSGWMEDDIWPNSRPITPYIIDNNFSQILIKRSSLSTRVEIIQDGVYKIPVINELKLGNSQQIKITKNNNGKIPIIVFSGTVAQDELITLPVLTPEIAFRVKMQKALEKNSIIYNKPFGVKKIPSNAQKIASVSHNIADISRNILHNSDNFSAEVVFKVAGAKYINYSKSASLDDAINMFYDTYKDLITSDVKIADGSGVSRYNLINTEIYVKLLKELFKDENYKNLLATANQGTLKDRLLFLENNIRAKTGTLSNMSSIAGTFTTKKGKSAIFAIIIQNSPKRKAVLKNFENTLIGLIYRKY